MADSRGFVYVYDADGNYQSDRTFPLTTGNSRARGIAWDGAYLYVVDNAYFDRVYVYDADGNHQSDRTFRLATGTGPYGIAWDGAYLYVVGALDVVYVYDRDGTHVG